MPTATIAIDVANFPEGSSHRSRQHRCITRLIEDTPDDFEVRLGIVAPDAKQIHSWPRDGFEKHSDKHVPYVTDLLDYATSFGNPLGGFINSDIFLHPAAFPKLRQFAAENVDVVLLHRTDVTEGQLSRFTSMQDPTLVTAVGTRVAPGRSIDGVLFSPDAWALVRDEYPDTFTIGEPWWDTAMIQLIGGMRLEHKRLYQGEVLHIKHGGNWSFSTPWGEMAHKAYQRVNDAMAARRSRFTYYF